MVEIKTDAEMDAMRVAGQVVGQALAAVRAAAAPGMRLLDLDEVARTVLREAGADSPFLGYRPSFAPTPFPAVLCVSVNDAIVLDGLGEVPVCGNGVVRAPWKRRRARGTVPSVAVLLERSP
ncbi:hypothetical protein Sgleb_30870 [Streptomyces glebosus]|uniref:Peptidase M24 domain-containing protein n=1 Tax=Streptomyces glebosus TaxID=249580 RepID=A0A640SVK3_9ACTN|nr:hypothetical protein Sgleb_30870 [Streptomyces glebosus]GHG61265.1 hypothetical protein GCM10010513_27250 [Streptomyces glebosus]